MQGQLDDFFRCVENADGWVFEVGVVAWDGPHTPRIEWKPFRRWKTSPDERRLQTARAAALNQSRFFRACSMCHDLKNVGHMHDHDICQGCAEGELGVVY